MDRELGGGWGLESTFLFIKICRKIFLGGFWRCPFWVFSLFEYAGEEVLKSLSLFLYYGWVLIEVVESIVFSRELDGCWGLWRENDLVIGRNAMGLLIFFGGGWL